MQTQELEPLLTSSAQQMAIEPPAGLSEWLLRCVIVGALAAICYAGVAGQIFQPLFRSLGTSPWCRFLVRPSIIWGTMGSLLLAFRTFLWFRYRPFPAADVGGAPTLTVIIPAYNEGHMVEKSIASVAAAAYPRDRLEILVVDDGSSDDTWNFIRKAARRHAGLVTAVRFPENRGKRAALETGFRQARGDIVVTIDSDSVIESTTLLAIAGPFRDPAVGAVAGKVVVYNRHRGLIPRMLHVRYVLSFDFLRAAQSTYRTVYCCPGALSAYRTEAVRRALDHWVNQTFWGSPCTYGEDRSMTNYILSFGYDTVYQRTAVVHTEVPEKYVKLSRMFLRWDRSYVKEEIRLARIVWKRPLVPRIIAMTDAFITNLRYPISYSVLGMLVVLSVHDPATILRLLLSMGLLSFLNSLYYFRSERSWDFLYGIIYSYFSFFTLFWIFPVAVLTVRSRSWMTR